MIREFQFELASTTIPNICTTNSTGHWAYTDDDETFSSLNITYDTHCDVKVGNSGMVFYIKQVCLHIYLRR